MDVHVVLPAPSHLDYSHVHAGQVEQRCDPHARACCQARVLNPLQRVQSTEEGHLYRAAAVQEGLQVVPLPMYPDSGLRCVQISKEGQPRLQPTWIEAGRREEIKIFSIRCFQWPRERAMSPLEPWEHRSYIFQLSAGLHGRTAKRAFRACRPPALAPEDRLVTIVIGVQSSEDRRAKGGTPDIPPLWLDWQLTGRGHRGRQPTTPAKG